MERRQGAAGDDARDRIQGYLERSGLAAGKPRVVPLTGDASDRRYFRILLPDAPSIVLALNSAPFDVATLPFVNVATLIATLQRRGAELKSPEYLPYGISFDVEKLTWELDFFTKHFLEAYRGVTLAD